MMEDRCFVPYCRKETSQCVNGRWCCDKHIPDAFEAIAEEGN